MTGDPLVGRLVDVMGRRPVADRSLAILARPHVGGSAGAASVVARTTTAHDGSFVTARPRGTYVDAFVVLDDGSGRLHVELELDGSFPDELVVFLNELESHLRYAY